MRIMIDTNVLVSGLLFPASQVNAMMEWIMARHRLVISSYVLSEFRDVVARKFPSRKQVIDGLLKNMSFELVFTPDTVDEAAFEIRDAKDYPVLYTAIVEGVDVLVTGDKDFADVDVDMPEIMTPRQFADAYM